MDQKQQEERISDSEILLNLRFVKTILMLLVILGHSVKFWEGNWFTKNPQLVSESLAWLSRWIASFHIYAFTLVSGYIFTWKVRGGGYNRYMPFLRNKAKRLLIPYVFVAFIWVAPISAYFFDWDLSYLVKKYLFCINPSQLWFLWMLFGVFVIVWPIRKIMLEKSVLGYGISVALYGIGIVGGRLIPNIFCIWTSCQYVVFFYIGMRMCVKQEKHEKLLTKTVPWIVWLVIDILLFVGTILLGRQNGIMRKLISTGLTFLLNIVGAIMVWIMLEALAMRISWQKNRVFRTLEPYSMPMYLFHEQIIYFTITWLNGKVNPWINAGVNFAIAFVGSFLISALLMHWKATRILIGEKIEEKMI